MMSMKRQTLVDYGAPLQFAQGVLPSPLNGEVLLRVSHCGLCHSDLHVIDGHFNLGDGKKLDIREGRELPFTPGHEICGTIEAHGPSVMGIANGSRLYAVYPWIGCGSCARCQRGDEHLCDLTRHLGIHRQGGFATHVLVPHPRYLIDVDGIDPAIAGSYMCSGLTAYSALRKAMAAAGDGPLLIMGLGGVGFMALELARSLTHRLIVVADIDARKREAAEQQRADLAIDPQEPEARKALRSTAGRMAAALDFVGSADSVDFAQSAVGKGGVVVVVGLMGGRFSLAVPMFPLRQLSILGSFVGSLPEARELIGLVRQGRVGSIPVTVRPLEEANSAIEELRAGSVLGRIALKPSAENS
jgi:D-arabinose 1-dehydrogenase-like Zn-dependent alcohol dehydrogenase